MGFLSGGGGGGGSGIFGNPGAPYQDTGSDKQRKQQIGQISEQRKNLNDQAETYRNNLGSTQDKLFEQSTDPARQGLAARMNAIDEGANSRGLLYSGLKQGEQAGAAGAYASQLAGNRANINSQTNQISNEMNQTGINAGLAEQEANQSILDDQYKRDMQARQARQGVVNKLGNSAGGILGNVLGGGGGGG